MYQVTIRVRSRDHSQLAETRVAHVETMQQALDMHDAVKATVRWPADVDMTVTGPDSLTARRVIVRG